ncbi:MAG: AAA family ATPase [Synechococcaceae cyanobacterium RM1_1_27]|nr:AAA family ATPase [Synechococcaceae cyanobacterium RM1_1_27]
MTIPRLKHGIELIDYGISTTLKQPSLCHCLVGCPGSGKSTLAHDLVRLGLAQTIVSTDQIRQQLHGDPSIQGSWPEIEREVLAQFKAALSHGIPVVYDATNAVRSRRLDLLRKLALITPAPSIWIAWHLITPLQICQQWNQQRDRQVPDAILEQMSQSLMAEPPTSAEGWKAVLKVDMSQLSQLNRGVSDVAALIEQLQPWNSASISSSSTSL